MVTPRHEGLTKITTLDLGHTAQMLQELFDLPLNPSRGASLISCGLSECIPTEYRADAALLYGPRDAKLGVVIEVQLKKDVRKHESWLAYIANLRARDHCGVCLVVICPDQTTARWARKPIETGHPGLVLTPLVIGPDNTPVITDVAEAVGNIGLAAVSAITHGKHPQIKTILAVLAKALDSIDREMAQEYADCVIVALDGDAQEEMKRMMAAKSYLYQSDYAQKLRAEGRAEGEAEAILMVLDARRVLLSEGDRDRIRSCTDLAVLDEWVRRAIVVESADDLFA
ncbi:hypothetical protein ACIBG8_25220 [Nonomuraea sp. NPDC050556]|uniref:hypothetical protein n=1 Tax=Nonomuraea sp. NPDC050556 TaxID=3364369 RepID=UPI0037A5583A